jgi:hypothetical protein
MMTTSQLSGLKKRMDSCKEFLESRDISQDLTNGCQYKFEMKRLPS